MSSAAKLTLFIFMLALVGAKSFSQIAVKEEAPPDSAGWRAFRATDEGGLSIAFRLFDPVPGSERPAPLLVFLNGSGTNGADNGAQIASPAIRAIAQRGRSKGLVIIAPQCPFNVSWDSLLWIATAKARTSGEPSRAMLILYGIIEWVEKMRAIDASRRMIAGFSLGAFGALDACLHRPDFFRAALSIAGGCDQEALAKAAGRTRYLFVHGGMDSNVRASMSIDAFASLRSKGLKADLILYEEAGHAILEAALADRKVLAFLGL